jgi:hypothetical protein
VGSFSAVFSCTAADLVFTLMLACREGEGETLTHLDDVVSSDCDLVPKMCRCLKFLTVETRVV